MHWDLFWGILGVLVVSSKREATQPDSVLFDCEGKGVCGRCWISYYFVCTVPLLMFFNIEMLRKQTFSGGTGGGGAGGERKAGVWEGA